MTRVRKASADDIPQLVQLINYAYRDPSLVANWKSEAALLDGQRTDALELKKKIGSPENVILVIVPETPEDAEILGCVHLELQVEFVYLGMLTIRIDQQNQGLAKKLLLAAEQFVMTEWKRSAIKMTVIAQRTELIQYYERCGYSLTGEVEPFPYGDPTFGHPKRTDLYFKVLAKSLSASPSR